MTVSSHFYVKRRTCSLVFSSCHAGLIFRFTGPESDEGGDEEDSNNQEHSEVPEDVDSDDDVSDLKPVELDTAKEISTADLLACRQEVLNQRRLRIGLLCSGILESPEAKVS